MKEIIRAVLCCTFKCKGPLKMHTNPLLNNHFTKQVYTHYSAEKTTGLHFFYAIVPDNVSSFAKVWSKGD